LARNLSAENPYLAAVEAKLAANRQSVGFIRRNSAMMAREMETSVVFRKAKVACALGDVSQRR